jgi:hypothetical protein
VTQSRQRSTSRRQRPEVREQVMCEQHRLRALQMCVSGKRDLVRLFGARQKHVLQLVDALADRESLPPQVEAEIERHLVVATATGMQFCTGRTGNLGDASFDRGVNVFVGRRNANVPPASSCSTRSSAAKMIACSSALNRRAWVSMFTCAREPTRSSAASRRVERQA